MRVKRIAAMLLNPIINEVEDLEHTAHCSRLGQVTLQATF